MPKHKYSRIFLAAIESDRNQTADLYYEDGFGGGYMAVVRYHGRHWQDRDLSLSLVSPRWSLLVRDGWSLPFEEHEFTDEPSLIKAMRECCPDMRRWKLRYSFGSSAWWNW